MASLLLPHHVLMCVCVCVLCSATQPRSTQRNYMYLLIAFLQPIEKSQQKYSLRVLQFCKYNLNIKLHGKITECAKYLFVYESLLSSPVSKWLLWCRITCSWRWWLQTHSQGFFIVKASLSRLPSQGHRNQRVASSDGEEWRWGEIVAIDCVSLVLASHL